MIIDSGRPAKNQFILGVLLLFAALIIAAILFPVFVKAKSRSGPSCQSRMRDIGLALSQYAEDNDSALPNGIANCRVGAHMAPDGVGWIEQLQPYLGTPSSRKDLCPDDDTPPDTAQGAAISYGFNDNAARVSRYSRFSDPSKTVDLFEVSNAHFRPSSNLLGYQPHPPYSPAGDGTMLILLDGLTPRNVRLATGDIGGRPAVFDGFHWPEGRHGGGANYLMGDGHVQDLPPDAVSSGRDARAPQSAQTGGVTGRAAGTANTSFLATFSTR